MLSHSDAALKRLNAYLHSKIEHKALREMGWFDFFRVDRSVVIQLDVPPEEAIATAFIHLALNDRGNWSGNSRLILAFVGFLSEETRLQITESDVTHLKNIIRERPVSESEIRQYFSFFYRYPTH